MDLATISHVMFLLAGVCLLGLLAVAFKRRKKADRARAVLLSAAVLVFGGGGVALMNLTPLFGG